MFLWILREWVDRFWFSLRNRDRTMFDHDFSKIVILWASYFMQHVHAWNNVIRVTLACTILRLLGQVETSFLDRKIAIACTFRISKLSSSTNFSAILFLQNSETVHIRALDLWLIWVKYSTCHGVYFFEKNQKNDLRPDAAHSWCRPGDWCYFQANLSTFFLVENVGHEFKKRF